ncbi:hypothetical protein ACWKWK_14710 [Pseudoxanthomonas beigongshangi]
MRRLSACLPACLLLAALLPTAHAVSPPSTRDSGDAAHLFGYWPKPGQRAAFDEGYRRHLAWHRQAADPLVWYGWYVSDGKRAGMFVDGSFGAPFAAFDQRIDPAGDGADAGRNVTPFVEPAFRASYRLRRDLSSGFPLERWQPSPRLLVTRYVVRPGARAAFERAVRIARAALPADAPAHSWYEPVTGDAPGYLHLVALGGWQDHDRGDAGLDALLAGSPDPQAEDAAAALAAAVLSADTETWEYRADLSLIPDH